jgi:nucleoside-diphosphate-sugar epimerase
LARVLVTGATGFVGRTLCDILLSSGHSVRAATRVPSSLPGPIEQACVGEISGFTKWAVALEGVDAVIHAAARAHVLHDTAANSDLYVATNTDGTTTLARACAQAAVRRFVYLSTIKVNGEETNGRPYTADDEPKPLDAYGRSKWQAERSLLQIAIQTGMQAVIVRPPLVYGPGVRANFLRLMRWVDKRFPLPLGAVHNRRSLVSIWNLCDLLVNVIDNPAAPGKPWLVSDAEDLSTPDLIRRIGVAMQRPVRLLSVPPAVLYGLGTVLGRRDEVIRLCGSLAVDVTQTQTGLGWSPPITVSEGLARTAAWYHSQHSGPQFPRVR